VTPPTDPRLSFDEAADVYDQVRPRYPAALFDDLFHLLPDQPSIVEVGPGTGQATRDLLHRGANVRAVEIGPAMADRLRSNLDSSRLEVIVGDFEEVPLETKSCDSVFSATAYHWVSAGAQVDRPATLLRPGGVVAIVDLNQVSSPDDEGFFDAVQHIYDRYGQGHIGPPSPTRIAVDPAIRQTLASDGRFADVVVRSYDWNQTYSATEYRTLMLSYSGTLMMQPAERSGLLDDIESFVLEHFDGQIVRPLVVTLTTARVE
jgi:SAM-dependent methyltransferase